MKLLSMQFNMPMRFLQRANLDMVERVVVASGLFVLAWRYIPVILETASLISILLLASEAMVVVFVLFRRRTQNISVRPGDWLVGLLGTTAPLLAIPYSGTALVPAGLVGVLMVLAFVLQLSAKLTLRRSFGVVAANRGVKISGPYRLVRHPMYAGYILTHIAILLAGPNLWNVLVYGFAFAMQLLRITAEERILSQDSAYGTFALAVPYRLLPHVY